MNKFMFVSLALATALATAPAATAESYYFFNLSGTCTQGGSDCDNQDGTTNPAGTSSIASTGAQVSITANGYFTLTGSGPTLSIVGFTGTVDGLNATVITSSSQYVQFSSTIDSYYYPLKNTVGLPAPLLTQTDPASQTTKFGKSSTFTADAFDNQFTPAPTAGNGFLDLTGIDLMLSNGAIVDIFADGDTYWWNEVINGAWLIDPNYNTDITGEGADPMSMDIVPSPEPSSLLLLGTGLLFMAGFLFRKAKPSAIQSV
jgi:hypothetical protein